MPKEIPPPQGHAKKQHTVFFVGRSGFRYSKGLLCKSSVHAGDHGRWPSDRLYGCHVARIAGQWCRSSCGAKGVITDGDGASAPWREGDQWEIIRHAKADQHLQALAFESAFLRAHHRNHRIAICYFHALAIESGLIQYICDLEPAVTAMIFKLSTPRAHSSGVWLTHSW